MEARTDGREDGVRGQVTTREADADVRAERRREVTKSGSNVVELLRETGGDLNGQWGK